MDKNKTWKITFGVIAGILTLLIVYGIYWYNKAKTDGKIIVNPNPAPIVPGKNIAALQTPAAAGARQSINIPANTRIVPGTYVSTPDGNVVDLYSYTQN